MGHLALPLDERIALLLLLTVRPADRVDMLLVNFIADAAILAVGIVFGKRGHLKVALFFLPHVGSDLR